MELSHPRITLRAGEYPCINSGCGILCLAGIGLDLLQDLLDLIGLANVEYREIDDDGCNDEHAKNQIFHEVLLSRTNLGTIIHKGRDNPVIYSKTPQAPSRVSVSSNHYSIDPPSHLWLGSG